MYIIVCMKQAPDSGSVYIDPITGQVDVERFVQILNPADACAVEAAVRFKEQLGGTVLALTVGPQDAEGALRAALAIGADSALRIWSPRAAAWGPFTVAAALAAYVQKEVPQPDLILCGDSASDWSSGVVGPALAEKLGLPLISGVTQFALAQERDVLTIQATRRLERGYRELLAANCPLLVTVTADLNEPRYPALPAHLAALRAGIPLLDPHSMM
ncbi:MAG: electron transfer flavoprotein subunit beta/FixA family protein, partial [Chloroflexota bacterium]|nr:electron transfer flavoprotein subunit beta/FixA family protein [Chloroflexota bacterium]